MWKLCICSRKEIVVLIGWQTIASIYLQDFTLSQLILRKFLFYSLLAYYGSLRSCLLLFLSFVFVWAQALLIHTKRPKPVGLLNQQLVSSCPILANSHSRKARLLSNTVSINRKLNPTWSVPYQDNWAQRYVMRTMAF